MSGTEEEACPFCVPAQERTLVPMKSARPGDMVRRWKGAYALVPLRPLLHPGHLIVIPETHAQDFAEAPDFFGIVAALAAELTAHLRWDANLIVSKGVAATQTVRHLHVHVLRRTEGDAVSLPWDVRGAGAPEEERARVGAAAQRLREIVEGAPRGPWSFDARFPPCAEGHFPLFAADGDPFAAVQPWAGALPEGPGTFADTIRYLLVFDPVLGRALVGLVEAAAQEGAGGAVWKQMMEVADVLLARHGRKT